MTVRVGCVNSYRHHYMSGAPQVGAMSPSLFILHTIELTQMLKVSVNVGVQVNADDVKIYEWYNQNNRDEVCRASQQSLEKLISWAMDLDLVVNLDKCCVLHRGGGVARDFYVTGVMLEKCENVNDLGILIDGKLKFSIHICSVVSKDCSSLFTIFPNVHA
ncbi:unnamed protein product [Haemonchus placei]|uniref:Reverse transcriptase domain-containing protein n=1 Tax=Haemonchus placei TaxID=6290 RepID=A0A0N4WMN0_HAEPC|nr:unnamed protein product [Haemonchus placei]